MPTLPGDNYVLCGRGKMNAKHAGNKKFANIISECLIDYMNANSRIEKSVIITSVTSQARDSGLKFVIFDASSQSYTELSSYRVHEKVSFAIRDQIKQNEKLRAQRAGNLTADTTKLHNKERNKLKGNTKNDSDETINRSSKKRSACSNSPTDGQFDRSGHHLEHPMDKKMRSSASFLPIDKSPSSQKDSFATSKNISELTEDILRFPDANLDLGARVEQTRASIAGIAGRLSIREPGDTIDAPTINPWSDISTPEGLKGDYAAGTNLFPLSVQSLSPLPVDTDTNFEYQDIQRVCAILDQDEIEPNNIDTFPECDDKV